MKRQKSRWDTPMGAPCLSRDKIDRNEFKIPFGLDDNDILVSRSDALKIQRYRCPACDVLLVVRHGPVRDKHFAHQKKTGCSLESVVHKTAKKLLILSVFNWKNGIGDRPRIRRYCKECGRQHDQPLPDNITTAIEEYRLPFGVQVDVALFSEKNIAALVEIFVTHDVDSEKRKKLSNSKWMEISADKVIENPSLWVCRQESLLPLRCKNCIEQTRVHRQQSLDN